MNISQMRAIDFLLGGIICILLDAFERVRRVLLRTNHPQQINKILVSKYLGMGSILLATPTLRTLRSAYPDSYIVFLTFESNAKFAERLSDVDELRFFRTSSVLKFAIDVCTILLQLRREKFDLFLDLEFFARFSTIVSYLSRSKMRVGYYLPKLWRGELLTHSIYFNPYRHVTEVFAAQLAPLGLSTTDFSLALPTVFPESDAWIKSLLQINNIREGERIIAVNVNSSDLSIERRWPLEYFVSLISVAAEHPWRKIILVGSLEDKVYVSNLYSALSATVQKKVLNLAGRLTIGQFMALLKNTHLFISNDSGPLHIAAAFGVATVSFFGPETPTLYGPTGQNHEVFYAGLYCSPCLNVYNAKRAMCKADNRCMQMISSDEVIRRLTSKGIL